MYDNVCEEKKYSYDFNWVPPNLADNYQSLLRASREQLGMPVWGS